MLRQAPVEKRIQLREGSPVLAESSRASEGLISRLAEEGKIVEVFALMYTQPAKLTGVPKKVPDLMEVRVAGGSIADRVEFAASLLGKSLAIF